MAEFSLGYDQTRPPPGGGGVEWYSAGTGGYNAAMDYSYTNPGTSAAYGTFDDEPPLLEGTPLLLQKLPNSVDCTFEV